MIIFISGGEIIVVMLVALLLFGSKSIPDVARTLGKGMREFKKATSEIRQELENSTGDLRKDIDEVRNTVQNETRKITRDIEDVSEKVRKKTTAMTSEVDKELHSATATEPATEQKVTTPEG